MATMFVSRGLEEMLAKYCSQPAGLAKRVRSLLLQHKLIERDVDMVGTLCTVEGAVTLAVDAVGLHKALKASQQSLTDALNEVANWKDQMTEAHNHKETTTTQVKGLNKQLDSMQAELAAKTEAAEELERTICQFHLNETQLLQSLREMTEARDKALQDVANLSVEVMEYKAAAVVMQGKLADREVFQKPGPGALSSPSRGLWCTLPTGRTQSASPNVQNWAKDTLDRLARSCLGNPDMRPGPRFTVRMPPKSRIPQVRWKRHR